MTGTANSRRNHPLNQCGAAVTVIEVGTRPV
jgi:hypothetical protein